MPAGQAAGRVAAAKRQQLLFLLLLALLGIFGGIEKETGEVHAIRALEHHRRLCRPLLPGSPGGLLLSLLPLGLSSESAAGHILVILVLFRV